MKKNNKIIIMIISIIFTILLAAAGTMAYWYWSGLDQAQNLVVSVAGIRNGDIIYEEGESHIVGDFGPTSDYYKSIGTTIKFRKSQRVKEYSLLATVHLDVNALGTNMSESNDIHWVVTTGNSTDSCPPFFHADVNFDGEVDNYDVRIIYNYAKDHMSDGDILYGDVEEPYGVLDIDDGVLLLQHVSMPNIFPLDDSVLKNADVNLDGSIDIDDSSLAVFLVQDTTDSLPSEKDSILYGDVNLDGKVTTYDYAYLARHVAHKDTYPLCNSSDVILNTGTFKGVSSGETINVLENIEVTTEDQVFTVWVWLDSNGDGVADLSGETIDTNVWTEITMYNAADNGNVPVLDKGMIPVTIADDGTVTTVANSDPNWYNYNEQRWANVVLVNENATEGVTNSHPRSYYKTNIGEEVTQDDILAYFVWIPRYKYAFPKADGNPEEISIIFENKDAPRSTGTAKGSSYYTHPAFTFGDKELSGIWVGKFETSVEKNSDCYINNNASSCNVEGLDFRILNDVNSVKQQKAYIQFLGSLSLSGGVYDDSTGEVDFYGNQKYGLTKFTDSHMLKNSEWGAVAYLSHSKYGRNKNVRINNYNNGVVGVSLTGCGAASDASIASDVCAIPYGSGVSEYPQSTTGNITGVFDMSGGGLDRVMGNYDLEPNSSGFDNKFPESKYFDLYSADTFEGTMDDNISYCTLETCGGHALHETKGWYSSIIEFVYSSESFFVRGGRYDYGGESTLFTLSSGVASYGTSSTFRIAIINVN